MTPPTPSPSRPVDAFLTPEITLPCHLDIFLLRQQASFPRHPFRRGVPYLQTLLPQGYVSLQENPFLDHSRPLNFYDTSFPLPLDLKIPLPGFLSCPVEFLNLLIMIHVRGKNLIIKG